MQFNKLLLIGFGLALTCAAAWSELTSNGIVREAVQRLDDMGYDLKLRAAALSNAKQANSAIVIVDIDEKSLKEQGRWPWPRNKIAELITKTQAAGATVIALDMGFPEPEPNIAALVLAKLPPPLLKTNSMLMQKILPQFDYDQMLAQSIKNGETVLGMTFHDVATVTTGPRPQPVMTLNNSDAQKLILPHMSGYTNNIALLNQAAKSTGFINAFADSDGIIRHAALLLHYQNGIYPSLALEAARLYLLSDIKLDMQRENNVITIDAIQLGKQIIPTDIRGRVLIPFRGPAGSFPYFSATDILNNRLPANALLNKLVFMGTSAFGLGDLQSTAVGSAYPGVEIHANIAAGILANHFPKEPTWLSGAELIFTILMGLLFSCLFPLLAPRGLIISVITIPAFLILANSMLFEKTAIVASVAVPILLIIILATLNMAFGYLLESRRRDQLKNIFGQYLAPAYIEELLKQNSKNTLAGESREMTVLFSDIRSFTSLSEKMAAADIKALLNLFFTPMTKIIFECNGTIDKYVGDMIMAFWGAPLPDAKHPRQAIIAALAMQAKVRELNPLFIERGLPALKIGIGINTGLMNVGDMGSEFRRAYTVIGDTVNLASRLESLTKYYGVDIIAGEQTYANQPDFVFRKLDYVRVKGKEIAVTIYEPLCTRQDLTPALQEELAQYEQALGCYFNKQWQQAIDLFKALVEKYPDSRLYSIYLARSLDPARQSEEFILPTLFMEK